MSSSYLRRWVTLVLARGRRLSFTDSDWSRFSRWNPGGLK
jgi:hypothetical protein